MLSRGISRWHPRPLEAIAEAANTSGVLENQLARLRRLESLTEAPVLPTRLPTAEFSAVDCNEKNPVAGLLNSP